jgi:hypothetical protein
MSATDERLARLLERWRASLELHGRYLELDDAEYARVQDWPRHERPGRWLIDLSRTRLTTLQGLLAARAERGDAGFAEALELMAFLTTLLGSEHVERFIPLAQPRHEAPPMPPLTVSPAVSPVEPKAESRPPRPAAAQKPAHGAELPRSKSRAASVARAARNTSTASKRRAAPPPTPAPAVVASAAPAVSDKATATVIADAVRMISWGREWPQLAGLIARLADRPPEAEVWKILRQHRADIEARARRPRD